MFQVRVRDLIRNSAAVNLISNITVEKVAFYEKDVESSRQTKEAIERKSLSLNEDLNNAYGTIATTQQEVQEWMSLAEYYQKNFSQWLDGINHVSQVLQGIALNIPDTQRVETSFRFPRDNFILP